MTLEIQIRPARADELKELLAFEQGIIAAERPFDPTLRMGEIHYYDLAALVASDDAQVLVAECAGRLVASGFAQLRVSKEYVEHRRHAYLGFMFVAPDHRGRGLNGRIVRELIDWARARGVTELQLEVYAQNAAAIRAYEKLGFRPRLLEMRLDGGEHR